jgi:hypothetical protein
VFFGYILKRVEAGDVYMKWIGGAVLLIITIIMLIMAMFMFPWFKTKTEYNIDIINENSPEYWNQNADGIEHRWDESIYYLEEYEMKCSTNRDWERNGGNDSASSGKIRYDSSGTKGGWDGSYRDMAAAGYPVQGYLAGGKQQLNVFNYTYYMVLLAIILSIVGIILVAVAGVGKISPTVPKVVIGVTVIFVVLAPLYFAFALPPAIRGDDEELFMIQNPLQSRNHTSPAEGNEQIMGEGNENIKDNDGYTVILSTKSWGPELGWWFSVVAIFTAIITIGFVEGKTKPTDTTPRNMRSKYHEFDRPEPGRRRGDEFHGPSDRGRGRDDYYDDYDRGSDSRYDDDYAREDYPPPRRRSREPNSRRGPAPDYDYGRPPPRPPRRGRRPPPPDY